MSSENNNRQIAERPAYVRAVPGIAHDDRTKLTCRLIYATSGGRSPARTERLAGKVLTALNLPTPTQNTIAVWANEEDWHREADAIWRHNADQVLVTMQANMISALATGLENMADISAGVSDHDLEHQAVQMAAFKITAQAARDLAWLTRVVPPDEVKDDTDMTRDELEADARASLVKRKRSRL